MYPEIWGKLTALIVMARRGRFTPEYHSPMEISGLYWHFVDIIWIFLCATAGA